MHSFLKESVSLGAPRYRMVMPEPHGYACPEVVSSTCLSLAAVGRRLVQNEVPPVGIREMVDIESETQVSGESRV